MDQSCTSSTISSSSSSSSSSSTSSYISPLSPTHSLSSVTYRSSAPDTEDAYILPTSTHPPIKHEGLPHIWSSPHPHPHPHPQPHPHPKGITDIETVEAHPSQQLLTLKEETLQSSTKIVGLDMYSSILCVTSLSNVTHRLYDFFTRYDVSYHVNAQQMKITGSFPSLPSSPIRFLIRLCSGTSLYTHHISSSSSSSPSSVILVEITCVDNSTDPCIWFEWYTRCITMIQDEREEEEISPSWVPETMAKATTTPFVFTTGTDTETSSSTTTASSTSSSTSSSPVTLTSSHLTYILTTLRTPSTPIDIWTTSLHTLEICCHDERHVASHPITQHLISLCMDETWFMDLLLTSLGDATNHIIAYHALSIIESIMLCASHIERTRILQHTVHGVDPTTSTSYGLTLFDLLMELIMSPVSASSHPSLLFRLPVAHTLSLLTSSELNIAYEHYTHIQHSLKTDVWTWNMFVDELSLEYDARIQESNRIGKTNPLLLSLCTYIHQILQHMKMVRR